MADDNLPATLRRQAELFEAHSKDNDGELIDALREAATRLEAVETAEPVAWRYRYLYDKEPGLLKSKLAAATERL